MHPKHTKAHNFAAANFRNGTPAKVSDAFEGEAGATLTTQLLCREGVTGRGFHFHTLTTQLLCREGGCDIWAPGPLRLQRASCEVRSSTCEDRNRNAFKVLMGLNQWVELRYLGYYHRGSVVFQIRRVLNQGPRECGAEPCKAWRLLLTPRPRPAAAKERRAGRRIGFVLRNRKKVVSACTAAVDSQKPSQTWLFLGAKKTLQCLYSRCTSVRNTPNWLPSKVSKTLQCLYSRCTFAQNAKL